MSAERHGPLVSCESTFEELGSADWVIFDVQHDLMNPEAGPAAYAKQHIPGAFHAHVDRDLCSPKGDGKMGRHPLPDPEAFTEFLRAHGVNHDTQVVCYDAAGGMWAGRLWWLLRDYGHKHVAVLDGGLKRWQALGLKLSSSTPDAPQPGKFAGVPGQMPIVDESHIDAGTAGILVDARAPERFRGDVEPVDPKAGHIPGAVNLPFAGNLGSDGMFLSPDELRARYEQCEGSTMYCGSGVTGAHNVLAMELAGFEAPALYPGSWSAWSTQGRDAETG